MSKSTGKRLLQWRVIRPAVTLSENRGVKSSVNLEDNMKPYVIVRTSSAGVFAGTLESKEGKVVVLTKARRLWYWEGAASLSQLAQEGVKKPNNCKFPIEVDRVELTEAIEILDVTPDARANIAAVPVWKQ